MPTFHRDARLRFARSATLALALSLAVVACATETPLTRSANTSGTGGGVAMTAAPAREPSPSAGSPSVSASANRTPTKPPTRTPSKRPSTQPPSPTVPWPTEVAGRIPKFPPAPAPAKITLPGGDRAAWLSRIPTEQPVAFITIDDGWSKRPEAVQLLRTAGVPVTMFLTINAIRDNPAYFRQFEGATIEAHSITHTRLLGKSYEFQKNEICGSADQLGELYGKRPTLFRPPFGDKDDTTLRAAHDCGIKAAFFWKETVDKGIVRYQTGSSIQRGDIILMHFRDQFADDFIAALQAISAAGLTPALLESYLP